MKKKKIFNILGMIITVVVGLAFITVGVLLFTYSWFLGLFLILVGLYFITKAIQR